MTVTRLTGLQKVILDGLVAAMAGGGFKLGQYLQRQENGGVALGRDAFTAPAAAVATNVLGTTALTAAIQTITTFALASFKYPRQLQVVGNAGGITGNVVITGTNVLGRLITDTLALNGTTPVLSVRAFKSVTKVSLPVETHAGTDSITLGYAAGIGLSEPMEGNTVLVTVVDGVTEGTPPTVTSDKASHSKNIFTPNTAANGSRNYVIHYIPVPRS